MAFGGLKRTGAWRTTFGHFTASNKLLDTFRITKALYYVTGLSETFSISFARSKPVKSFALINLENMTVAWDTENSTSNAVIHFFEEEIKLGYTGRLF